MQLANLNQLRASLEEAIQEWAEGEKTIDTYNRYWGEETVALMTEAALAVLGAVAEFQDYAEREGFFTED